MRIEAGAAEYRALVDAMEHTTPACLDDWRYIQERDEIDPDDLERMATTCRTRCPLFGLCDAYARAGKPNGGMWAGRYWGRKERTSR